MIRILPFFTFRSIHTPFIDYFVTMFRSFIMSPNVYIQYFTLKWINANQQQEWCWSRGKESEKGTQRDRKNSNLDGDDSERVKKSNVRDIILFWIVFSHGCCTTQSLMRVRVEPITEHLPINSRRNCQFQRIIGDRMGEWLVAVKLVNTHNMFCVTLIHRMEPPEQFTFALSTTQLATKNGILGLFFFCSLKYEIQLLIQRSEKYGLTFLARTVYVYLCAVVV